MSTTESENSEGEVTPNDGYGEIVFMEQPEWGDEIVIGDNFKLQRPLNSAARNMLGGYVLAMLDLYDHFQGRIDALEAEVASLKQQDST